MERNVHSGRGFTFSSVICILPRICALCKKEFFLMTININLPTRKCHKELLRKLKTMEAFKGFIQHIPGFVGML